MDAGSFEPQGFLMGFHIFMFLVTLGLLIRQTSHSSLNLALRAGAV
jgi:hypothetical protein